MSTQLQTTSQAELNCTVSARMIKCLHGGQDANKILQEIRWDTCGRPSSHWSDRPHVDVALSASCVDESGADHAGGEPHGGQCGPRPTAKADNGRALGGCLEPQLISSFISGFLSTLRKVDSDLAGKLRKGEKLMLTSLEMKMASEDSLWSAAVQKNNPFFIPLGVLVAQLLVATRFSSIKGRRSEWITSHLHVHVSSHYVSSYQHIDLEILLRHCQIKESTIFPFS